MRNWFTKDLSRIGFYSVTSTTDSAFVIGGYDGTSNLDIISKYKNGEWSLHGNLKRSRRNHGSITYETQIMVFGGTTSDGL